MMRAKGPECSFYYKETYDIIALQKFFSPVTWAAAKELKWDPDGEQAWPGLTWHPRGGERVARTPSAETVSVVPLSHIWNHHGSAVNWTWKQGFRCGVAHMVAVSLYRQALVPSCLQQCLLSPLSLFLSELLPCKVLITRLIWKSDSIESKCTAQLHKCKWPWTRTLLPDENIVRQYPLFRWQ